MSSRNLKAPPSVQPQPVTGPVEAFRATVPRVEGCLDCEDVACLFHALESALTISDVMAGAFRDAVPRAVEGERVPGLEQTLRAMDALVQANASVLGELDEVPGGVLQGLAIQVQALKRGVLR